MTNVKNTQNNVYQQWLPTKPNVKIINKQWLPTMKVTIRGDIMLNPAHTTNARVNMNSPNIKQTPQVSCKWW